MAGNVRPNGPAKGTGPSSNSSQGEADVAGIIQQANIDLSKEKELKTKQESPINYKIHKASILQAFANIEAEKPTPRYGGLFKYNLEGKYVDRIKRHLTELHKNLSDHKTFSLTDEHKQEQDKLILDLGELIFNKVIKDTEDIEKAMDQCRTLHTEISLCLKKHSAKKDLKTNMNDVFLSLKKSDKELEVAFAEIEAKSTEDKYSSKLNKTELKLMERVAQTPSLKPVDPQEVQAFMDEASNDDANGLKLPHPPNSQL